MWKQIVIIFIILPIIGCLFGYFIAENKFGEQEVSWESLGTPPSPAVRIIHSAPDIVVSSGNGQIYKYVPYSESWKLVYEEPLEAKVENFPELCQQVTASPLKGTIDSKDHCARFEMGSAYYKIAILENGSVWMWNESIGMYGFDYIFHMFMGSFGFFIIGLIIIKIMRLINRREIPTIIDI